MSIIFASMSDFNLDKLDGAENGGEVFRGELAYIRDVRRS